MNADDKRAITGVFAATDGTGGAGVFADCRAITAAGGLPLAVITAVTAQNLNGVAACHRLPAGVVRAQFAALAAAPAAAVKIGVAGNVAAVAQCLKEWESAPVVWDPVLAPTAGAAFAGGGDIAAMRRRLLPRAHVLTPNRGELCALADERRVAAAVVKLLRAGAAHVLVTDMDGGGGAVHCALFCGRGETPVWEAKTRRRRGDYHGSGCLFSATLAARLARGDSLPRAAAAAHQKTLRAIDAARRAPALGRQRLLY